MRSGDSRRALKRWWRRRRRRVEDVAEQLVAAGVEQQRVFAYAGAQGATEADAGEQCESEGKQAKEDLEKNAYYGGCAGCIGEGRVQAVPKRREGSDQDEPRNGQDHNQDDRCVK